MPTDNPTNVYATGDGVTKTYSIPFTYLDPSHVKITVDGVAVSFTFTSPGTVELATAPAVGTTIRRYRETPEDALVTWADGAVILGKHLNLSQTQSLFIAQEAHDYAEQIAEEAKQFALDSLSGTINTALTAAVTSLQSVIIPDRDAAAASATSAATDAATATAKAAEVVTFAATIADFQKRYLGAKTANPTLDNDGGALVAGALYFNTSVNEMRAYDGAAWAAAYIPSGSDVASFNGRTGAVTPATGDYSVAQITGLPEALATKADDATMTTALAAKADASTVTTALAGKSNTGHGHAIADVTGLQSALDGKAATGHGHVITDVTGLQTALDGKEPADADILKKDATADLAVGYTSTSKNQGTKASGTFTPDLTIGAIQHFTNGGAFTLAPPTADGSMILDQTNNSSAGTITRTGFTKVTGDALTTTSGHKFRHFITKGNGGSHCHSQALQ